MFCIAPKGMMVSTMGLLFAQTAVPSKLKENKRRKNEKIS